MTTFNSLPDDTAVLVAPEMERVEAYEEWKQGEGVPIVTGFYIEDLKDIEVGPWGRKGANGAIINLEGTGGVNDTHVVEIPPGRSTNPERHLYEEMVYVLSGRGATTVWYDDSNKQTFEWGTGAVFAVPINAWAQHHNGSGAESLRFMSVTNLPTMINTFHNDDFIFNNPFVFNDRFTGEDGYFDGSGRMHKKRIWETNFVPDVRSTRLYSWKERGAGGTNVFLELAQNSMGAHISQFPVGTYKKAHRHGPGAHVIILGGVGFSLLWQEGDEERVKADWKPGSLVVPPRTGSMSTSTRAPSPRDTSPSASPAGSSSSPPPIAGPRAPTSASRTAAGRSSTRTKTTAFTSSSSQSWPSTAQPAA